MFNLKLSKKRRLCISGFADIKIFAIVMLVVFLLSGVVWGSGLVSIKFRDVKRNSDISGLQKALEIYNNNNGKFPASNGAICLNGNDSINKELISKEYLTSFVRDPKFPDLEPKSWPPLDKQSCYYYESDGNKYFIGYCTEGLLEGSAECKYIRK